MTPSARDPQDPARAGEGAGRGVPPFREALRFWLRLGFISFGGPAGQIAILHEEVVARRRWITEDQFLNALNYCMLLPGPEAQQLATYVGWLLHRTRGALAAGTLFVLPSAILMWAIASAYVRWGRVPGATGVLDGLRAAVLGIVLAAVVRLGRRALRRPAHGVFALGAFACLSLGAIPFPILVLGAAALGFAIGRWHPSWLSTSGSMPPANTRPDPGVGLEAHRGLGRLGRVALAGIVVWWGPALAVGAWLGWDHAITREGLFFGKAATITVGGAYAVLPYVAREAVQHFGWLSPQAMIDGLAFAETTPGPLIMVLQFVGFLGAWNHPAPLSPAVAAALGAAITTWTTFAPSFVWILLGAPYLEAWRRMEGLSRALSAVTAAVVGVILSLGVWFGGHVLMPGEGPLRWDLLALAVVAFLGTARWKWPVGWLVLGAGAAGWLLSLVRS